jgi:hypothetical protein
MWCAAATVAGGSPTSSSEIDEVCWVNNAQDRRCAPAVSHSCATSGRSLTARQRCPASPTRAAAWPVAASRNVRGLGRPALHSTSAVTAGSTRRMDPVLMIAFTVLRYRTDRSSASISDVVDHASGLSALAPLPEWRRRGSPGEPGRCGVNVLSQTCRSRQPGRPLSRIATLVQSSDESRDHGGRSARCAGARAHGSPGSLRSRSRRRH